jgi:hypothetical protein
MSENVEVWQRAEEGEIHARVFDHVSQIESEQALTFDRFVKLEALYDPNGPAAEGTDIRAEMMGVAENGIASNVDTVTAVVATTDVRSRYMTDGANWSQQRQAKQLEWYVEGVGKQLGRTPKCRQAFRSSAKKGTGLVHVRADAFQQLHCEHVLVDDIVVPDRQCTSGRRPREMHRRRLIDREDLIAEYPEHEEAIRTAHAEDGRMWAGYRPMADNELVVLESWYLPFGVKGHKRYRPGRYAKTIRGLDLEDKPYHKPRFPFAEARWSERDESFYGISGAERIMGTQRALNRRNLQIERQLDLGAFPTTFVRQADAKLAVQTTNRIGQIVVVKSEIPETKFPPAVSGETMNSRLDLRESMNNEFGHSSMATHAAKPAGIDSGAAIREWRDATTQRFATQEKMFEELCLDVDWLIIDTCKDLAAAAPVIMKSTRWGTKKITWAKVDMGDVKVQSMAASTLPRTPAGRSQLVMEWAQAGVITLDESRRLMQHPDLEKELSLYTAAIEAIEEQLEEIAEGHVVMPEPFDNLALAAYRAQQTYLIWRSARAPEQILEGVRQYTVNARYILKMRAANTNVAPGAPDEAAPDAGADPNAMVPELQSGAPPAAPGVAALSPQAMMLRAG